MPNKYNNLAILLMEEYRQKHSLTGEEVSDLFLNYGVYRWLVDFYEMTHTLSLKYLIDEIEDIIKSGGIK